MARADGGFVGLKRRALAQGIPMTVHLELTYACNWHCSFCYNPRRPHDEPLACDEWTVVLDELRGLGTLTVVLTGGEPLARPDFLGIAEAVRQRAFALRLFTNAALVTEEMAERIAGLRPLSVESSLHGASAMTHDRATGVAGSFDAMWRGLARLQSHDVRLVVKTPLTQSNEAELDQIIELVEGHGLPLRIDPNLLPRDDGDLSPLRQRSSGEGVGALMDRLAEKGAVPSSHREPGGFNCGVGRLTMAVDPGGNVFPCIQWRRSSLGNVRQTPLGKMWREAPARREAADEARQANERILRLGQPAASFPYCPALNYSLTGDALLPEERFLRSAEAADAARLRAEPRAASTQEAPTQRADEARQRRPEKTETESQGSEGRVGT